MKTLLTTATTVATLNGLYWVATTFANIIVPALLATTITAMLTIGIHKAAKHL